ncbi:MAG: fumarate hydratase [Sphingobacteriaceae bacterium]
MRKSLLFIFFLPGLLGACKFNPNEQGKGVALVQGEWEEEPVTYRDSLLQYTRHDIKFSCDSFYVTLKTKTQTNTYPDSCFNQGEWTEYARGIYQQGHDTLYLSGTFTKANWKQKISGCYRIGQYLEALIIEKNVGDTLYIKSLSQHVPVKLVLKKRIVCQPKPLN